MPGSAGGGLGGGLLAGDGWGSDAPTAGELKQNIPPFNPATTIPFALER